MRRRDFLKATTLATGVSLLEACSGPEEQYLVQPARRKPGSPLPGESTWVPGMCQQCSAGCGIQVRIVDGNARKIEGNPNHPVNLGGVCALGQSALQELYNPDRILAPQRRVGDKGTGTFEDTTWEDGLTAAVETIARTSPDRIAIIGADRSGLTGALWRRFSEALGAPAPAFVEAPELEVERRAAQIVLGVTDIPYFDVSRSDYILSIGSAFLDRWRSPVHYTRALAEMRRGQHGRRGRLVQAEARMSLTAANADDWLAVSPGTEGVLARTLAGILLSSGEIETDNAAKYQNLFPGAPPGLEEGAALCAVAAEKIERIATELAAAENKVVMAGGSAAGHQDGLFNVAAALGLNVLLGTLGKPGGVFAPASFDLEDGIAPKTEPASMAELATRLRGEELAPVDLLIVVDADPVHTLPASWQLHATMANVGMVIVLSSFRTDTTLLADLVLPLNTQLERFDAVSPTASIGVPVLNISEPAVEPLGDARHPADVVLAMAAALGEPIASQFPWASFPRFVEARIEEQLEQLPGSQGMAASAFIRLAVERGGIFGEEPPSLVPPGPLDSTILTSEVTNTDAGDDGEYPFLLLPFESIKTADGRGANRPWLQELPDPMSTIMWNSWLELSPVDAANLGIQDGDRLSVESSAGNLEVQAVIDPAVRAGVVGMPLGHGHQDYGRYAKGRGANPLDLVEQTQVIRTAAPAWAATRVRIKRLSSGHFSRFGRSYTNQVESENIPVGWAPQETSRYAAAGPLSPDLTHGTPNPGTTELPVVKRRRLG